MTPNRRATVLDVMLRSVILWSSDLFVEARVLTTLALYKFGDSLTNCVLRFRGIPCPGLPLVRI